MGENEKMQRGSLVRRGSRSGTVTHVSAKGWVVVIDHHVRFDDDYDDYGSQGVDFSAGNDAGGPAAAGWEVADD